MELLIKDYLKLLNEIDAWFALAAKELGAKAVACGVGCRDCCRGLFDISLPEAYLLRRAFLHLPPILRAEVQGRAEARLTGLRQRWPNWQSPYLLNGMPDEEWTEMPEDDLTPCPLLGEDGRCLVYDSRPATCRLHGLPAIDTGGSDFSSALCSRNLVPEGASRRYPFRELFRRENELFRQFTLELTGRDYRELDTFIPLAVLIDFETVDWQEELLIDPRI